MVGEIIFGGFAIQEKYSTAKKIITELLAFVFFFFVNLFSQCELTRY